MALPVLAATLTNAAKSKEVLKGLEMTKKFSSKLEGLKPNSDTVSRKVENRKDNSTSKAIARSLSSLIPGANIFNSIKDKVNEIKSPDFNYP